MLIGADQVMAHQEVALAIAGRQAMGITGLVLVTVGAAFSTGSAINSTLFATARLAYKVAEDGELPAFLEHRNHSGIPDRAVIGLGSFAAILAGFGSLGVLVETASLAFLFTFTIVSGLAFAERAGLRIITGTGAVAASAATVALLFQVYQSDPLALIFLIPLVLFATLGRRFLLVKVQNKSKQND
jgi:hypothetical protein